MFTSKEEVESASDQESKINVLLNTSLYSAIILSLAFKRDAGEFAIELWDWFDTLIKSFSWEQEKRINTKNGMRKNFFGHNFTY